MTHLNLQEALPPAWAGAERPPDFFVKKPGQLWRLQTSTGDQPGHWEISLGMCCGQDPVWVEKKRFGGVLKTMARGTSSRSLLSSWWEVLRSSRKPRQGQTRQSSVPPAPSDSCPCCWLSLQHIIKQIHVSREQLPAGLNTCIMCFPSNAMPSFLIAPIWDNNSNNDVKEGLCT